jgi:hypothetical protein
VRQPFSKDYTSPPDQAWRAGFHPDAGTLGPNASVQFKNAFASKLDKNPDYKGFYDNGFFQDIADQSQVKIDNASRTSQPNFKDPADNTIAQGFLNRYLQGVERGLISEEDRVGPDKLRYISSQDATAGSSERSPQTASKFPGESGTQIG